MKLIKLQPAPVVDRVLDDGTELTRLPYPYFVAEDGSVDGQDFWRGEPDAVVGFQDDVDVQRLDLSWADAWQDPQRAVGKFPVLVEHGHFTTLRIAVDSMTEVGR